MLVAKKKERRKMGGIVEKNVAPGLVMCTAVAFLSLCLDLISKKKN